MSRKTSFLANALERSSIVKIYCCAMFFRFESLAPFRPESVPGRSREPTFQ